MLTTQVLASLSFITSWLLFDSRDCALFSGVNVTPYEPYYFHDTSPICLTSHAWGVSLYIPEPLRRDKLSYLQAALFALVDMCMFRLIPIPVDLRKPLPYKMRRGT